MDLHQSSQRHQPHSWTGHSPSRHQIRKHNSRWHIVSRH